MPEIPGPGPEPTLHKPSMEEELTALVSGTDTLDAELAALSSDGNKEVSDFGPSGQPRLDRDAALAEAETDRQVEADVLKTIDELMGQARADLAQEQQAFKGFTRMNVLPDIQKGAEQLGEATYGYVHLRDKRLDITDPAAFVTSANVASLSEYARNDEQWFRDCIDNLAVLVSQGVDEVTRTDGIKKLEKAALALSKTALQLEIATGKWSKTKIISGG